MKVNNVLISVWDKSGLKKLADVLNQQEVNFIATGSTALFLEKHGYQVTKVSDVTAFPEILNGRVKTLHPKIFGGILHNRKLSEHGEEIQKYEIPSIDMVICNLYPFEDALNRNLTEDELVEFIDIGGVTLIRAAAKSGIPVLCDVSQYNSFIEKFSEESLEKEYLSLLRGQAFLETARYDSVISRYYALGNEMRSLDLEYTLDRKLRYGENPHQQAFVYRDRKASFSILDVPVLQGKALSYNNLMDVDVATSIVKEFNTEKCCAILKHANACGLANGNQAMEVYEKALAGDPMSAFGGIVCVNYKIEKDLAERMNEYFFEIIIASEFSDEAKEIFSKKKNLRLIEYSNFLNKERFAYLHIEGGLLYQEKDWFDNNIELKVVTHKKPTEKDLEELLFAFKAVKTVKSNGITVTKNKQLLGMGTGQPSRVDAVELALKKAGDRKTDAYLGSDAFFPFPDSIEIAHEAGIKAIIQPGGSIKDKKVIEKADELDMVMVFTGKRHFRH